MAKKGRWSDLFQAEGPISEFFVKSDVGLAVFDEQMRYRMLNPYLAASNGASIESHIGKHVREILADEVGMPVERAIEQVFVTALPVLNCELVGTLPTKPDGGHWIDTFFPIIGTSGRVEQVGAVVIELAQEHLQFTAQPSPHLSSSSALRSWKEIAQYVGTCIKTVQRWEQAHALPVRRVNPSRGSVVFALPEELDDWLRNRALGKERAVEEVRPVLKRRRL